jgi:hypothetical protein
MFIVSQRKLENFDMTTPTSWFAFQQKVIPLSPSHLSPASFYVVIQKVRSTQASVAVLLANRPTSVSKIRLKITSTFSPMFGVVWFNNPDRNSS